MSYAIACARANVFRGVAIYNGAVLSGYENGNEPIAFWQMAGFTDGICTAVEPETVHSWHRAGFGLFWRYKSGADSQTVPSSGNPWRKATS